MLAENTLLIKMDQAHYERKFERLVEEYLRGVEENNRHGVLKPARSVIDQLARCRRHNYGQRDAALLGQARTAGQRGDARWLRTAAADARQSRCGTKHG